MIIRIDDVLSGISKKKEQQNGGVEDESGETFGDSHDD